MVKIKSKQKLSIGEMAKLCNVSIKALRHYDTKGLLKPSYIDPLTNYRYYTEQQILAVMIIKEYKSLNFTLEEIKTANQDGVQALLDRLKYKLMETNKQITELTYVRDRISEYVKAFGADSLHQQANVKSTDSDFSLKKIPEYDVVFIRYKSKHNPSMMLERYRQLSELMDSSGIYKIGPLMAVFHDDYKNFDYNNADIEVCCAVIGNNEQYSYIRKFGGYWAVTGLHNGPYDSLIDTYRRAINWIEDNNLLYLGPAVERYIIDAVSTRDISKYVTEVILPVKELDSPAGLDITV